MENVREIVLDALIASEKGEDFSHRLIKAVLDKYDYLDGRDKAFIKRVTEGTIERRIEMDYYLNQYASLPVSEMKPVIRNLLRMSVYQLLYMDGIPDSAVCNEACKLAAGKKFHHLKGFVNGVLRSISRAKVNLILPDKQKDPAEYYSVKYSMPPFLVQLWLREYGENITETMLESMSDIHPVSLRFPGGQSEEQLEAALEALKKNGVSLERSPYSSCVYLARKLEGIKEQPGFAEGAFIVQDISSVLAVQAAGIKTDDLVMDVCAAPGGKSILAAEKAKQVLAGDVSEYKTGLIRENADRMRAYHIKTRVHDAGIFDPKLEEKADVLLLDVPCSSLGVMGKKRDIKYHVTEESLKSIVSLQKRIVENSWRYVKPGGTLLYSTCTLHRKENQEMVRWILERYPFEPEDLTPYLPERLLEERERLDRLERECPGGTEKEETQQQSENLKNCWIQLIPGFMETDGFFFARLKRRK